MTHPEELKQLGLKVTGPRLKILRLFEESPQRHLSAEDIYRLMLSSGEDMSQATIYRVLSQFEQAGLLERNHFESGRSVFELREERHHDHIVCLDCGRVEEFCDSEIETRQSQIAMERGFRIESHTLCLYGRCQRVNCPHSGSVTS